MNSSHSASQSTTPGPSPRQILAEKIAILVQMRADVAAIGAALENVRHQIYDTRKAIGAAEANIEAAKENAASYATDLAMGLDVVAPQSVSEARAAHQHALDALDALIASRSALEQRLERARSGLEFRESLLADAVRDAVKADPAVLGLLEVYGARRRDFEEVAGVVDFLRRHRMLPDDFKGLSAQPIDKHPAVDTWQAAIDALKINADAPLPAVE